MKCTTVKLSDIIKYGTLSARELIRIKEEKENETKCIGGTK